MRVQSDCGMNRPSIQLTIELLPCPTQRVQGNLATQKPLNTTRPEGSALCWPGAKKSSTGPIMAANLAVTETEREHKNRSWTTRTFRLSRRMAGC